MGLPSCSYCLCGYGELLWDSYQVSSWRSRSSASMQHHFCAASIPGRWTPMQARALLGSLSQLLSQRKQHKHKTKPENRPYPPLPPFSSPFFSPPCSSVFLRPPLLLSSSRFSIPSPFSLRSFTSPSSPSLSFLPLAPSHSSLSLPLLPHLLLPLHHLTCPSSLLPYQSLLFFSLPVSFSPPASPHFHTSLIISCSLLLLP